MFWYAFSLAGEKFVELCPPLVEYSLIDSNLCFFTELPIIKDIDKHVHNIKLGFLMKNKVSPQMTIGIKISNIEYNNSNTELKIIYNDSKTIRNVFIKFDNQSQSAYQSFVQNIKEFNRWI